MHEFPISSNVLKAKLVNSFHDVPGYTSQRKPTLNICQLIPEVITTKRPKSKTTPLVLEYTYTAVQFIQLISSKSSESVTQLCTKRQMKRKICSLLLPLQCYLTKYPKLTVNLQVNKELKCSQSNKRTYENLRH